MILNWAKTIISKPSLARSLHVQKKGVWKERLAVTYAIFGCLAFGSVLYAAIRGKVSWVDYYGLRSEEEKNIPAAIQWAPILGVTKAKVYQYSGFTKVSEYEINEDKPKE